MCTLHIIGMPVSVLIGYRQIYLKQEIRYVKIFDNTSYCYKLFYLPVHEYVIIMLFILVTLHL